MLLLLLRGAQGAPQPPKVFGSLLGRPLPSIGVRLAGGLQLRSNVQKSKR